MENKKVYSPELFERIPESEKNAERITFQSKTYLADVWHRFKQNKLALAGLIFVCIVVVFAIIVPIVSPYTYDQQNMDITHAMPSLAHPFGTDKFGRDIMVRIAYGARISLAVGICAAFINLCVGMIYGGIAGYLGGKVDLVMMRIVDIMYSVPDTLYIILIMVKLGANITSILIGICVSSWMGMARQVRAQVMTLKEQEFCLAAKVLGASHKRILFKHLIINSMGPIIVSVTMMVPSAIYTEAFLSFIGIGISRPAASWGTLANDARSLLQSYPVEVIWPIAAICLTMLSLNFIGEGLGSALDPKKK